MQVQAGRQNLKLLYSLCLAGLTTERPWCMRFCGVSLLVARRSGQQARSSPCATVSKNSNHVVWPSRLLLWRRSVTEHSKLWLPAEAADVPSTPAAGASTPRRASGMTPRAGSVTPRRLGLSGGARRVTADEDGDYAGIAPVAAV